VVKHQFGPIAAALTRSRAYQYEITAVSNNGYIFWHQIHSYSQTQANDIKSHHPIAAWGTKKEHIS
jgi:hypothetical protein